MSMFNKKVKYEIVCDMKSNLKVQRFAEEHATKGSTIDVYASGSLLDGNNLVTVGFVSKEKREHINECLKEYFKDYNWRIGRYLGFVYSKKEES